MHELAITQGILDLVAEHAAAAGAARVTAIDIVVGEMSGFLPDSIQFYWDELSEGTVARGATLRFRRVPLRLACADCGSLFPPGDGRFDCSACGSPRVRVAQGRELRVESIDVEETA